MTDEPLGMRPCEDDGMDARVAIHPVDQLLELVGDLEAEQAVRAAVDPDDQHGSAVLDLEVALVFVCHGSSSRDPCYYNDVIENHNHVMERCQG
jgi:hypothetical protein